MRLPARQWLPTLVHRPGCSALLPAGRLAAAAVAAAGGQPSGEAAAAALQHAAGAGGAGGRARADGRAALRGWLLVGCGWAQEVAAWWAAAAQASSHAPNCSPLLCPHLAAPPEAERRHGLPCPHAAASTARFLLPSSLAGAAGAARQRQQRAGGRQQQQGGTCAAGLQLQPHLACQLLQPAGGGLAALLQVSGVLWVRGRCAGGVGSSTARAC